MQLNLLLKMSPHAVQYVVKRMLLFALDSWHNVQHCNFSADITYNIALDLKDTVNGTYLKMFEDWSSASLKI